MHSNSRVIILLNPAVS